jgi:hypothetical protein
LYISSHPTLTFTDSPYTIRSSKSTMPGRLDKKVCIITGGGSGFGKGIVEKFVAEGAKVLIWDIHPTYSNDLAAALPKGTCVPFTGDVSKADDWTKALETVLDEWGVLDVVVNNAGVVHRSASSITVSDKHVSDKIISDRSRFRKTTWTECGGLTLSRCTTVQRFAYHTGSAREELVKSSI